MPDDDRPRITRTTSLFAGARTTATGRTGRPPLGSAAGVRAGDPRRGTLTPLQQRLAENQAAARAEAAKVYGVDEPERRPTGGPGSFYGQFLNDVVRSNNLASRITASTTSQIGVTDEQLSSVASPLDMAGVDPNATFLFDRGAIIDPETGARTGALQSRGVYGSADAMERQLPAGQTIQTGSNDNIMTISAGVLWLRNLAARDKAAYNNLVVLLRNAGYGNLPAEDAALPLNGYSNDVGAAFALAANDLAQANLGGDNRPLLQYLTERGQGYSDLLAQQQADAEAEAAYVPVERQYQDPATLRASAKAAAVEALGRKLTDEEEARFEAAFRAREDTFYDQLDAAREGKTRFAAYAPDTTGQINEFIDGDEFETERASNRIGEYSQVFMRMMGAGS